VAGIPTIHYGNVDTGAMVNVVYEGVVRVFEGLNQYWEKFTHVLYGVGGRQTKIVGKLKDIPIILGKDRSDYKPFLATFYVI
jgi:hypothetical protein